MSLDSKKFIEEARSMYLKRDASKGINDPFSKWKGDKMNMLYQVLGPRNNRAHDSPERSHVMPIVEEIQNFAADLFVGSKQSEELLVQWAEKYCEAYNYCLKYDLQNEWLRISHEPPTEH